MGAVRGLGHGAGISGLSAGKPGSVVFRAERAGQKCEAGRVKLWRAGRAGAYHSVAEYYRRPGCGDWGYALF